MNKVSIILKNFIAYIVMIIAVILLAYISINMGNYKVPPNKIIKIISYHTNKIYEKILVKNKTLKNATTNNGKEVEEKIDEKTHGFSSYENVIVWNLRLPRIIMVLLVGAGLAICGAASQGIFRNPLVSPFILGVSSGASLGAALAIVFLGHLTYSIDLCAGIGGAIAVTAAFLTARRADGSVPRLSLVLSGTIISSLFTSLTGIVKYMADAETQLPAITFWMMGSFGNVTWKTLDFFTWLIPINVILMILFAWQLNVLSLGDNEASLLGMNTKKWKIIYIYFIVSTTGICVARTGTIGWVGLVIPHIGRAIVGPNHRALLPMAALIGAAFMLISDNIARVATSGEIPVGIITALIGTPFFIYYLRKKEASVWN